MKILEDVMGYNIVVDTYEPRALYRVLMVRKIHNRLGTVEVLESDWHRLWLDKDYPKPGDSFSTLDGDWIYLPEGEWILHQVRPYMGYKSDKFYKVIFKEG